MRLQKWTVKLYENKRFAVEVAILPLLQQIVLSYHPPYGRKAIRVGWLGWCLPSFFVWKSLSRRLVGLVLHEFLEEGVQILIYTLQQASGDDDRFLVVHDVEVGESLPVLVLHDKGIGA